MDREVMRMDFIVREIDKNICIKPSNPEMFGVKDLWLYGHHGYKNKILYCSKCDTWHFYIYDEDIYSCCQDLINNKTIDIITAYHNEIEKNLIYCIDQVEKNKTPYSSKGIEYMDIFQFNRSEIADIVKYNNGTYDFKQIDTWSLTDIFINSRKSPYRIEVTNDEKTCIYCKKTFSGESKMREEIIKKYIKNHTDFNQDINEEVDNYVTECKTGISTVKLTNTENINTKELLSHLVNTSSQIEYAKSYYNILYNLKLDSDRLLFKLGLFRNREKYAYIDSILKKSQLKLEKKPEGLLPEEVSPEDVGMVVPEEPEYIKVNIFNKKVAAEKNSQLEKEYNRQVKHFEMQSKEKISKEISRRKVHNSKILESYANSRQKILQEIESLKTERENIQIEYADSDKIYLDINNLYAQEIDEIKNAVASLGKIWVNLVGLNVVYPKYLNLVALSTMLEYFETGRCYSLDGPDGAYNLFEKESRENRIISQLDIVIDKLDQIQQTQYKTYMLISNLNDTLNRMDNKLGDAVKSLMSINSNVLEIRKNSDVIAYYSEKTAQYSKIQADLTNAIGFMMALK